MPLQKHCRNNNEEKIVLNGNTGNNDQKKRKTQLKYFPTIGTLLPTPKAFGEIRMIGQN